MWSLSKEPKTLKLPNSGMIQAALLNVRNTLITSIKNKEGVG